MYYVSIFLICNAVDINFKTYQILLFSSNMKKKSLLILSILLASTLVPVALAGKHGRAGKSNVAHLYLYEKDQDTWEIVEDGAWGKMKYNLAGEEFCYVFNGHGLEPGSDYTLIYYPDPWPGSGAICLGSGVADGEANVHIMGCVDTGDLPAESDENDGAKIWLVLSDDVDCGNQMMVGWNPTEYLFEYDLITFDDTDD
jgi:hypothetical protein